MIDNFSGSQGVHHAVELVFDLHRLPDRTFYQRPEDRIVHPGLGLHLLHAGDDIVGKKPGMGIPHLVV